MPSLNGINQVILLPWAKALSCTMPTLHNPFPGGCRFAKANRRALQIGITIQSSCLCTAHECDRQTRRTDIPVAVLNLRLLGWEASAFLVLNLVEFSSRDLKVLAVSSYQPLYFLWQVVPIMQHLVIEKIRGGDCKPSGRGTRPHPTFWLGGAKVNVPHWLTKMLTSVKN